LWCACIQSANAAIGCEPARTKRRGNRAAKPRRDGLGDPDAGRAGLEQLKVVPLVPLVPVLSPVKPPELPKQKRSYASALPTTLKLSRVAMSRLRQRAEEAQLASDLLEMIAQDDLYDAVLDNKAKSDRHDASCAHNNIKLVVR
jgi:hypothetical protein